MTLPRSPFKRGSVGLRVAQTETEAEMLLYDEVSPWGVTAEAFKRELDSIKSEKLNLRINSPGGDVFDSLAIYNALREHPAEVTTYIDGLAASMASVIALAGDHVVAAERSFFMIHHPWSIVIGNAADMRKEADVLEKISGSMVSAYAERTGRDAAELTAWMDEETWFTAAEAQDAGFIDEVSAAKAAEEEALATAAAFDLSIFCHAPDVLLHAEAHEPTVRDLERALRDAGLSQTAAKQYIAAGRAAAAQRDAEQAGERDVTPEPRRVFIIAGS